MNVLYVFGPNLGALGTRDPETYGGETLAEITDAVERRAVEIGHVVTWRQSNHEGELVDFLHQHMDSAAGGILNPAGLTQYSVSLHDAIKAMPFPMAEVHMSNIAAREEWRHHSIISPAVKGTVQGFGWRSYTSALRAIVDIAREAKKA